MSRTLLLGLLFIVAVGSGAGWFLANFEQVPEQIWVGFQGKARRDHYLAAQRLVQAMGMQAQSMRELPALRTLPEQATLFLPAARQTITPQLREAILLWIHQGGRLIIEAEEIHQPDPLLDELGVERTAIETDEAVDGEEDEEADAGPVETIEVRLPDELPPVKLHMNEGLSVDTEMAARSFGGRYATTVLLLKRGRGDVIVVNDFDIFSNYLIGEHDHAEFLWRLVRLEPTSREALFFDNPLKLSVLDWLNLHAWPVMVAGAALLLLWLWRAVPRFGPLQPDPERQRRRLLDHLRASGRFLWSNGGRERLLGAAREACLRHVIRAHPDLLATPEDQRAERLAQLLRMPIGLARQLIVAPAAPRIIDFLQTIRLYQEVHERLALRTSSGRPTRRIR
jgi:hypothetical protein